MCGSTEILWAANYPCSVRAGILTGITYSGGPIDPSPTGSAGSDNSICEMSGGLDLHCAGIKQCRVEFKMIPCTEGLVNGAGTEGC